MSSSIVYNEDCMDLMSRYPDKYFELAVVDPPYGIKEASGKNKSRSGRFGGKGTKDEKITYSKDYGVKDWDNEPASKEYFDELIRVSKNQIIWGANHFISRLPYDSSCWIVWDKDNGQSDFADAELAYTSFKKAVRIFKFRWHGLLQGDMKNKELRIHPTQKPVRLYDWIFKNYSKEGDKILDTHLGSGSSRIAAYKAGLDFVGCELDKEYFEAAKKRFNEFKTQLTMF